MRIQLGGWAPQEIGMRRRTFVTMSAGVIALWPFACRGQQGAAQKTPETRRVGVIASSAPLPEYRFASVLRSALADLGWVEGANLILDWRQTDGNSALAADELADLIRARPDVIIATTPAYVLAAKRATTAIPIVMVNTADPVELGIVDSLVRPGGNVTGTSSQSAEISLKQLELLTELKPGVKRVAVLAAANSPWHPVALAGLRTGGGIMGIELAIVETRVGDEIESVFAGIVGGGAEALVVLADPLTFSRRRKVAGLAALHRLPAVYGLREYAEAGGLISYWAEEASLYQRTAAYVDKILRGAKPSDLPIELPTRFELIVNLKAAKQLDLTFPLSIVTRANEVIE